jgi:hypothetical protein
LVIFVCTSSSDPFVEMGVCVCMGVAANPMMWYSIAAAAIDDTQELL